MRALAVFERDLRRMLRNPVTLIGSVLMPLAYLLILGNSLQGPVHDLPLGVAILDDGPEARALVGALQAVQNGPRTITLAPVRDAAAGMRMLRDGELSGLLVIPPRFSREAQRGMVATVGLFLDNVDAVAASALTTAVRGALATVGRPPARFELRLGPPELREEERYPRVDYDASLVPGVVVMAVFMGSMISGGFNLVMDRFLGVHESYLSTPLRRYDLAVGTLGSGVTITFATSAVVLGAGLLLTGARVHGGALGWLVVAAVQLMTAIGLMALMMIVLARTAQPRITGLVGGFLNVMLFFPSGALYPVRSFPGWLRAFARVNPETHAIAALKDVLFRGGDLRAAAGDLLFLAGFAAAMLALSVPLLRRRL